MGKVWKFGDDVDTDQILPGRYAPYMTGEAALARHAFIEYRPEFARAVRAGDIILAGRNFGCGSSREYAPLALKRCGIAAIVARSFARIFFRNALNLGIPLFESETAAQEIADGQEVELDVAQGILVAGERAFPLRPPPAFVCEILHQGGLVEYYRKHGRFPGEPNS
ncbi:MAG: homoaconitate hydratase [Chloroflexi bacterium]|nr:homoaconitate hydratase [Chloroflexota bacterium]